MDHGITAVVVFSSFVCIWRLRWDYLLSPAHVLFSVSCPSPLQLLWCERKNNAGSTWDVISLAQGRAIVQILFLEVLLGIQLHLAKHGHKFPSAPLFLLCYSVVGLSLSKPKLLSPEAGMRFCSSPAQTGWWGDQNWAYLMHLPVSKEPADVCSAPYGPWALGVWGLQGPDLQKCPSSSTVKHCFTGSALSQIQPQHQIGPLSLLII